VKNKVTSKENKMCKDISLYGAGAWSTMDKNSTIKGVAFFS